MAARMPRSGKHVSPPLPLSYADGLPRSLSDCGAVYFKGIRLPIVGRVSMDSATVDISALPEGALTFGSLVEVLGRHQTLEDIARDAQAPFLTKS